MSSVEGDRKETSSHRILRPRLRPHLVDVPATAVFSPLLGLFGLFGPSLAAIIMAAVLAAGLVSRPYVQRRASSAEVWRNGAEKAPGVPLSCCHCCCQPGHDHLRPLAGQLA